MKKDSKIEVIKSKRLPRIEQIVKDRRLLIEHIKKLPLNYFHSTAGRLIFTCYNCGDCCTKVTNVAITMKDCERMAKGLGIGKTRFINLYTARHKNPTEFRALKETQIDKPCVFYDFDKKGCKIYPFRSMVCRSYPLSAPAYLHADKIKLTLPIRCKGVREFIKTMAKYQRENEQLCKEFMQKYIHSNSYEANLLVAMLWVSFLRLFVGDKLADTTCETLGIEKGFEADPKLKEILKQYLGGIMPFGAFQEIIDSKEWKEFEKDE